MTIAQILQSLSPKEREDATWLLMGLLGVTRAGLALAGDQPLDPKRTRLWRRAWRRRRAGMPLQYALGSAPFYGREFFVDERVLIPRPETEVLVELSLALLKPFAEARVLDVGTGSGCVALTLKSERPELVVKGSDLSAAALAVARRNARGFGASVRFEKHDLFSARLARERWDLVVSNPPYLDFRQDKIAADVKKWEPRMALEPSAGARPARRVTRGAWCAESILAGCAAASARFTAMELSPRVAESLERRWRGHPRAQRVWRESDLAGRKRFLLVAWKNA